MKTVFIHAKTEKVIAEFDNITTPFTGTLVQFKDEDKNSDSIYICLTPLYELFGSEEDDCKIKVPVLTLTEHQIQLQAQQHAQQQEQSRIITPNGGPLMN